MLLRQPGKDVPEKTVAPPTSQTRLSKLVTHNESERRSRVQHMKEIRPGHDLVQAGVKTALLAVISALRLLQKEGKWEDCPFNRMILHGHSMRTVRLCRLTSSCCLGGFRHPRL